ncbi:lytic polysaccharide monooxygenase auxiliary activity family 9 protein [Pseudomonas syringae pv. atrofaciens]
MSDATTTGVKHGRITDPATRGSYAMDQSWVLEWHLHGIESGKNFPDTIGGEFAGFKSDVPSAEPPKDGLIVSGGWTDERECLNYTDREVADRLVAKGNAEGWPRQGVKGVSTFMVTWRYEAPHVTRGYRWFITKDGWDESTRLTRAHFQEKPFYEEISLLDPYNEHREELAPKTEISAVLPEGKQGHHVILLLWIVAESPMAFYQTLDVDFDKPPVK